MTSGTQELEQLSGEKRAKLIDEMMDRYVDWREECIALREAYERWSNASQGKRKLEFEGYRAALDLEEHASLVYADLVKGVEGKLEGGFA